MLELSNNRIGDEETHQLADAIQGNTVNITLIVILSFKSMFSLTETQQNLFIEESHWRPGSRLFG